MEGSEGTRTREARERAVRRTRGAREGEERR
jgi:hypothetical protein